MQIRLTPVVKMLLILCTATFLVQILVDRFAGGGFTQNFGLVPAGFAVQFKFWQVFTYALLHGDVMHLVLNLMMLAFVGSDLEERWGRNRFLVFFAVSSVSAGLFYLFLRLLFWDQGGLMVPLVGASGGIYGLLVAYGLLFGERQMLFMMLFPLKAKYFVWVLAGVEFLTTLSTPGGAFSSVAHLGGMAGGFLFLILRQYAVSRREATKFLKKVSQIGKQTRDSSRSKKPHLKLIVNKSAQSPLKDLEDDSDPKTWH